MSPFSAINCGEEHERDDELPGDGQDAGRRSGEKFLGDRVPKLPRNAHGVAVTPEEWVLSGLYFVRATDPAASPQDVAAAKQWLSANGWDVPA